jgi:predicted transcriptional regulator
VRSQDQAAEAVAGENDRQKLELPAFSYFAIPVFIAFMVASSIVDPQRPTAGDLPFG